MLRERQQQTLSTFVRAKRARVGLLCVVTLAFIYFLSTLYFEKTVADAPSALESCQPWPECKDAFLEELDDILRDELPDCASESNCETLADKLATLSMSLEKELASASVQDLENFLRKRSTKKFLARLEGRSPPKVDPRRKPLVCTNGDTEIPFHMPALVTEELLPSTIPRQLFFSGRTRVINRPLCENFQRIQYLNPEYDIYFFDDEEVNRFIDKSEFAAIRPLLDTIRTGAIRGDIWRYLTLLKFGGVYCDMDARWEGHLRDFIPRDVEIVSAGMPDGALSQWFMVFAPGHQMMAKAAEISLNRLVGVLCKGPEAQWEYKEKKFISGPPVLQDAFLQGLPVLSSEWNHVEKDKMLYFLSQNLNGFLTHNYDKVKESTKRQSIHWRNQGQSVLRPDLNRDAFTSSVCTEWKQVIKNMFERYLQFERRPNVTSVVDLLRS